MSVTSGELQPAAWAQCLEGLQLFAEIKAELNEIFMREHQ